VDITGDFRVNGVITTKNDATRLDTWWGSNAWTDEFSFVSFTDDSVTDRNGLLIGTVDASDYGTVIELEIKPNRSFYQIDSYWPDTGNGELYGLFDVQFNNLSNEISGSTQLGVSQDGMSGGYQFSPTKKDDAGSPAFTFKTMYEWTQNDVFVLTNSGTDIFSISYDGSINSNGTITGVEPWIVHTITVANEGITGVVNTKYMVDTTASTANITLTMPTTTQVGATVTVTDMKNNFVGAGTKNVITDTILFEGVSQTYEFDVANSTAQLVWTGASYGWKAIVIQ